MSVFVRVVFVIDMTYQRVCRRVRTGWWRNPHELLTWPQRISCNDAVVLTNNDVCVFVGWHHDYVWVCENSLNLTTWWAFLYAWHNDSDEATAQCDPLTAPRINTLTYIQHSNCISSWLFCDKLRVLLANCIIVRVILDWCKLHNLLGVL